MKYFRSLSKESLFELGVELGLEYSHLTRMSHLVGEVADAWLKREDDVVSVSGLPSWTSLVKALREIGQNGVAHTISQGQWQTWINSVLTGSDLVVGNAILLLSIPPILK